MKRVLPTIVLSQFFCTSLWFAGNAIIADIVREFELNERYLGHIASAVQFGFITGTFLFAVLMIADRFKPASVFLISAILAATFNFAVGFVHTGAGGLILYRFLTGFFLAGIYPVGMKIAADHYEKGLGRSLGFLVGALVLGTAFPHLLKGISLALPWKYVINTTSVLALAGGIAMYLLVPEGPYRKQAGKINFRAFANGFRKREFRSAAFGYFGHMWELYAFWVFVPLMLSAYRHRFPLVSFNVSLMSFFIIAAGSIACALSGILSQKNGAKPVATIALLISCICCLLSPLLLFSGSTVLFIVFLFIWSVAVIADSPMFSTMVAQNAPAEARGTSLTIVNCIGFSITIVSIQLINTLLTNANEQYIYMLLAAGPLPGLAALVRGKKSAA